MDMIAHHAKGERAMWTTARCLVVGAALLACPWEGVIAQETIKPFGRRIVGGEPTDIKQHPWQVALTIGANLCGGSIIAQSWVLTAAHCVTPTPKPSEVKAKANATDYMHGGVWTEIERTVVHEKYNPSTFEHDLALIKLKSPTAGRVIPLASAALSVPSGQPLEVTGWGVTAEGGTAASATLRKAVVPYVDNAACNIAAAYNGSIKPGMMCAGVKEGGIDACQGDSGGPLVWRTSDGPILVGVVSSGQGCARKLKYGVYTRVSAYRDWIDRTLAADRH
jgi:trypsin